MPKQHTYASSVDQAMENASNVLGMINLLQTQLKKDMDTIQAYQRQMTAQINAFKPDHQF